MDEDVLAILALDKAKALPRVKPFNCSCFFHLSSFLAISSLLTDRLRTMPTYDEELRSTFSGFKRRGSIFQDPLQCSTGSRRLRNPRSVMSVMSSFSGDTGFPSHPQCLVNSGRLPSADAKRLFRRRHLPIHRQVAEYGEHALVFGECRVFDTQRFPISEGAVWRGSEGLLRYSLGAFSFCDPVVP